MHYDPQTPFAVFLGPSLERSCAAHLFAANYYPPARMGDIYRLLGSGVRVIVLIDGLFHNTASVWQREILEALTNHIQVIGAASMGALRAAELHPFGMVGQGTIFEWYRDGFIDGDDEVALMHGDESIHFQAFSEPLVNIRYNFQQAAQQGYMTQEQAEELTAFAKSIYYADRSYDLLLNCSVVRKWPSRTRDRLIQFIKQKSVNLKKQDAISALRYCKTIVNEENHATYFLAPPIDQNPYYQLASYRKRGFLHTAGNLVRGEELLAELSKDAALIKELQPRLAKNYFLLLWAKYKTLKCPDDYLKNYREQWQKDRIKANYSQWLRANGLTARELQSALDERALLKWIIEQGPARFGLDFEPYTQFINALLPLNPCPDSDITQELSAEKAGNRYGYSKLLTHASETCYLAVWAKEKGIVCPSSNVERFIQRWDEVLKVGDRKAWLTAIGLTEQIYLRVLAERALYEWLIEKSPAHFGYVSWSFEVALLKELQITGRAAHFVAMMGGDTSLRKSGLRNWLAQA